MDADARQNRASTATVDGGTFGRRERSAVDAELLRRIVLYFLLAVAAVLAALEVTLARVGDPSAKREAPWISPLGDIARELAGRDDKAMDRVDEFVQHWAGGERSSNVRVQ